MKCRRASGSLTKGRARIRLEKTPRGIVITAARLGTNDLAETIAIKDVFGEYAYKLPISSSKSMLGHLICAAGVVELITCVLTIRNGVLVPTINYETPDPDCDLDYIPNKAREKRVDRALSNSFGFGGQNVSLIVSRFAG